jgi:hypothetical protein
VDSRGQAGDFSGRAAQLLLYSFNNAWASLSLSPGIVPDQSFLNIATTVRREGPCISRTVVALSVRLVVKAEKSFFENHHAKTPS